MLECFICLQEAGQLSVLLGSLPVIDEVLQRGQELDDLPLDLWTQLISLSKEADEVLIHAQIGRVYNAADFRSVLYTMLVDIEDKLFEVLPGRQAELHLLLRGPGLASRCQCVIYGSRCT